MSDERDEIRARVDIVELIGASVNLIKKGKSYKGLCPFHADKDPSLAVNPEVGRYQCWSCGEKGDIFTWVMKTQNVEFPEAIRTLAKIAGVTLSGRQGAGDTSQREVHHAAMAEAQNFFREELGRSEIAKAYCVRRGLTNEVLEYWGVGFSPEGGEALTARLRRKGFALAECKSLFLVDQDGSGGYFDKFRGRLMFPIWNEKGELVAFGGRVLGDAKPKYINSSDTPLYSKSRVLYGMNRARNELQKSHRAVLVEGYLDVIACHRAGVTSALASCGTQLSEEQAKLLKRWVEEVVVLYDSDTAGQKAADRASKILSAEGLKVRVALMPDGQDPDTLLVSNGAVAVQESVEKGITPLEFRLQALDRRLSPEDEDYWREAVAILAEAPSALELERQTFRLAPRYPGIRDAVRAEKALLRDIQQYRANLGRPVSQRPSESQEPARHRSVSIRKRLSSSEIAIFRAFVQEESRQIAWVFAPRPEIFLSDLAIDFSGAIKNAFGDQPPMGPPALWIHRIEPEELQSVVEELLTMMDEPMSESLLADAVDRLRLDGMQRKYNNGITPDMTAAERMELLKLLRHKKPDRHQKPPDDSLF